MNERERRRIWQRVQPQPNGCWDWSGTRNWYGYGLIVVDGRQQRAHRVIYEMAVGPIPEGRNVCHHCDRPLCVRPDHLFVGTQADNMADMAAKGRRRHFTGRPQKGETNYYAKLTEDDVRTIRKLEADGISRKVIAERFGIHPSNIYYIVSRKTWTHVL